MTHSADTITRILNIINEKGLHARASAKFVEQVERHDANAMVSRDGMRVSGDSIMGLLMLALSWVGALYLWRRGTLPKPLFYGFAGMAFSGWIATLAGWYTTEIGRQPWLVYGVLTTAEAVGPVPAGQVALTLTMYLLLYAGLLIAYVLTLYRLARKGSAEPERRPKAEPQPA